MLISSYEHTLPKSNGIILLQPRHEQILHYWLDPSVGEQQQGTTHCIYATCSSFAQMWFKCVLNWNHLMPNTRSNRKPPRKHSTHIGHEYHAYSCMNDGRVQDSCHETHREEQISSGTLITTPYLPWSTVISSTGYIYSNSQQYMLWLTIIHFFFMPKSLEY